MHKETKIKLLIENVWDKGQVDYIPEIFDEKVIAHQICSEIEETIERSHHEYLSKVLSWREIFPDWKTTIEDMFTFEDKVYIRWFAAGTHSKQLEQYEPSFETIRERTSTVYRFQDDKVIEYWMQIDRYGLYRQLEFNRKKIK